MAGPVAAPPGEVELDYVGSVTNAAKVLAGLKFNTALPPRLAEATLATRLADLPAATTVLREPVRFTTLET
ncbi:hypothetical protein MXD62_05855 [Frankia sp. Mgl5]|nr:hypothetical protein [Frankia sp. Mgl5]MCK9926695.1 hypothetical protein [Frankia sp. Mgl5]